jgi:hypothetical protein
MQSPWETTFGYVFTPNRPIYTRMGSTDSDEFRASIGVIISTPNRNRKSLLRSFRFPCKVNGKLHSAAISLQIVRFTRGWARSGRIPGIDRRQFLLRSFRFPCKVNLLSAAISLQIPTPNRNRKSLLRSLPFPCKVNGKLHSATISLQIVRFTRGWARPTRTNSGHRSASIIPTPNRNRKSLRHFHAK